MKYWRWYSRQRLYVLIAGSIVFLFLSHLPAFSRQPHLPNPLPEPLKEFPPKVPPHPPSSSSASSKYGPDVCAAYPSSPDLVMVVKTGASEIATKLPIQLMTFLQCAKSDLLIFSDMDQMLGEHHIYDALDEVDPSARKGNPDFDFYDSQQASRVQGEYVYSIPGSADSAWRLDKYKNIHTARKAWRMRPDIAWYFFIDADTYVFWSSLFPLLERYSPDEKWYLGSQVNVGQPPFAHGGSGYLLSRATMKELIREDKKQFAEYDMAAVRSCCGDQELAKVLYQKGINVSNVRPIIQGNEPNRINFGPEEWCQPLVTLHHMIGEAFNDMWQFELQRQNPTDMLTIESFYTNYTEPYISAYRENWENESADIVFSAAHPNLESAKSHKSAWGFWGFWDRPYKSFDLCSKACEEQPDCYMFMHHDRTCSLGRTWKLGRKKSPENKVIWNSGWNLKRIEEFRRKREQEGCAGRVWSDYPE